MIKSIIIIFRYQLSWKETSELYGSKLPIKSNPALQNAEILWKIENHKPLTNPNFGQKINERKKAPNASIKKVAKIINFVIFTIPPTCGEEIEFCMIERLIIPIFFLANVKA